MDVELRYIVLRLWKNSVFPNKEACLQAVISWLQSVLEQSIKAQIESLGVNFHNVSWKNIIFIWCWERKLKKHKKKINFTN